MKTIPTSCVELQRYPRSPMTEVIIIDRLSLIKIALTGVHNRLYLASHAMIIHRLYTIQVVFIRFFFVYNHSRRISCIRRSTFIPCFLQALAVVIHCLSNFGHHLSMWYVVRLFFSDEFCSLHFAECTTCLFDRTLDR
jgi:hypothetical protein